MIKVTQTMWYATCELEKFQVFLPCMYTVASIHLVMVCECFVLAHHVDPLSS